MFVLRLRNLFSLLQLQKTLHTYLLRELLAGNLLQVLLSWIQIENSWIRIRKKMKADPQPLSQVSNNANKRK